MTLRAFLAMFRYKYVSTSMHFAIVISLCDGVNRTYVSSAHSDSSHFPIVLNMCGISGCRVSYAILIMNQNSFVSFKFACVCVYGCARMWVCMLMCVCACAWLRLEEEIVMLMTIIV